MHLHRDRLRGMAALSFRIISFHSRLGGMLGHQYAEVAGMRRAAARRGGEYVVFISRQASAELRAELPEANAVLDCTVYRDDLSFDQRTADFVAMLHRHLDPIVRRDDRLLVNTATQCETRALASWLGEMPPAQRPWTLAVFHNDRWSRSGPIERNRRLDEFAVTADTIGLLDDDAMRRFMIGAVIDELRAPLRDLLGIEVALVPHMKPESEYVPPRQRPAGGPPMVGLLGGARREKGSDRIPAIIAEVRKLGRVDFAVQIANEDLPPAALEQLCLIEGQPGVTVTHGPLDLATYHSLLARIDFLLLPYERIPYRMRASGPFVEGCLIGRPAVVPTGTWMGDQVVAGKAAGVVYAGDDPAAIARAVWRASANLARLTDLARQHAPSWRRVRSSDAFLDWVEREIVHREADPPAMHRAPDGDRSWPARAAATLFAWWSHARRSQTP
jgi:glycosyltransferase involved in cell wall biosynthesis